MPNKKVVIIAMLAVLAGVATFLLPRDQPAPARPSAQTLDQAPPKPASAARTKAQAMESVMALPEMKAWALQLEARSGGKSRGALVEYDPAPKVVDGVSYWQFNFVENAVEAARPLETFLVAIKGDEILVEDFESDKLLTLQQWRTERLPLNQVAR